MNTIKSICSIAFFFINFMVWGDPVVTFTLKPYPMIPSSKYCHDVIKELGKMSHACTYGVFNKYLSVGIFVTYGGYLTISDSLGEISFPYKQTKPVIDLLITSKIIPIMMAGNTVHHWVLDEETPAAMFRFEIQKDTLTKLPYWEAQPLPKPKNNIIPLQTIIILAHPKHIYVPIGSTPMQESANIILPDIYVKKGLNNASQALYTLNIKHLFGSVQFLNKTEPMRSITLINP